MWLFNILLFLIYLRARGKRSFLCNFFFCDRYHDRNIPSNAELLTLCENIRDLQMWGDIYGDMIRLRDAWFVEPEGTRYLGSRLDGRPMLQQKLHNLDAILLASDMERREAVQSPRVWIGLSIEQQLGDPDVAAVRGNVERGQIIDGHLVHWSTMIQQHSCSIHVVSLRCHV